MQDTSTGQFIPYPTQAEFIGFYGRWAYHAMNKDRPAHARSVNLEANKI
jgi:hypothetical protein